MFKKIHSNRDPEKTIWSELNNEFAPYISKANTGFSTIISAYPKQIFVGMMLLIIVSAVLSFTVFRNTDDPLAVKVSQQERIIPQVPQVNMLQMIDLMEETLLIQKQLDSIAAKEVLSATDSLTITNGIKRLDELESILTTPK